jgi:hypothetical protein
MLADQKNVAFSLRRISSIGGEQLRREDAKKKPGNGKFEGWFGFTCQVKASSFGEMP